MDRITIHENPQISVWCYPVRGVVHHQMHKYCYGEAFRAALTSGLKAMIKYRSRKWLSDDRLNGPLPVEDEEWATKTWFPEVKAVGWKYWAMVQPHKVVGQMNVARFVKMYSELGITAQIFTELEPAFEWLDNQSKA